MLAHTSAHVAALPMMLGDTARRVITGCGRPLQAAHVCREHMRSNLQSQPAVADCRLRMCSHRSRRWLCSEVADGGCAQRGLVNIGALRGEATVVRSALSLVAFDRNALDRILFDERR